MMVWFTGFFRASGSLPMTRSVADTRAALPGELPRHQRRDYCH